MDLQTIKRDLSAVLTEYFERVTFPENGIFVVGCSTSEISGDWKGTNYRLDVGRAVVSTLEEFLIPRNIHVAIQAVSTSTGPSWLNGRLPSAII